MNTIADEELIEVPPVSCVRAKFRSISFPICPRCQRENGLAKAYVGGAGGETIVLELHKSIWDCFKSLWQPTYKNTLPLEARMQKIPGFWTYHKRLLISNIRKLNFSLLIAIKDKCLVWVVFKLLTLMRFLSKRLSAKRQRHVRQWIPAMVALCWGEIE